VGWGMTTFLLFNYLSLFVSAIYSGKEI